jgi:hypothetical protein
MWDKKNINAYLAVFFAVLVLGFVVHDNPTFAGSAPGHLLGIISGILILMTLIYPFRKRILKKKGRRNPLNSHITYGLAGASLAVVHSAHKLQSTIGILIFLSLVLVVLSGIIGRYLFQKVNKSVKQQQRDSNLLKSRIEQRKKDIKAAWHTRNTDDAEEAESDALQEWMEDWSDWIDEVRALAEIEYNMRFFDHLKTLFTRWVRIHHFVTVLLFALMAVHIMTTLYYGLRWTA